MTFVIPPLASSRPEQVSTRLIFFIAGFSIAAWAPLVPFVQTRSGIGNGGLGLLLLCFGVGSILAMPMAGALTARFGCRRVILFSAAPLCFVLPALAVLSNPVSLGIALLAFGAAMGATDVSMNIQAVLVERVSGRPMMSGFHGFYSFGGLAGAACMTALLGLGVSPFAVALWIAGGVAAALVSAATHLLPHGGERESPAFAVPRGGVLVIGVLCFAAFLAEGAILDWGAVFLATMRGMDAIHAGLGYTVFSVAMTVFRFRGDRIVRRFGGGAVIVCGGLCAAAGFAIVALAPHWVSTLGGYALVGAGCANIVPVLFTSAGRQTAVPEHAAISAVTTFGYAGILTGPVAIGFVALGAGLPVAFLILAVLQLGVAAAGYRTRAKLMIG